MTIPHFGLGRFERDGATFTGLVVDARVGPLTDFLTDWVDSGVEGLLDAWDENVAALGQVAANGEALRFAEGELRRHAPIRPRQVLGAGMNYRTHVIDLLVDQGVAARDEAAKLMDQRAASGTPFVFAALPTSVCGPDDDIELRRDSTQTDWELELAAVIGRSGRYIPREEALSYVAGWTIVNDLTAREYVPRTDTGPVSVDWLRSKCPPTYKPTGPYVVPAACVADPQDLRITLSLNGDVMQDDSTRDMIFDAASLIAYLSNEVQLLPGDVVMTGSPAGNGTHYDRFLKEGDVLEGAIAGLGMQRNRCVQVRP